MCSNKDKKRNISFDEHAYLSEQAEQNRQIIKKKYSDVFELAERVNKFANSMKYEFSIKQGNYKQQVMCGLFIKVIKTFNSAIILYEYGLEQVAIAVSRILLESIFKFAAINKNQEFYENYLLEDKYGLKDLKNRVNKDPDFYSKGYIEKIEERIKEKGIHNTKKPSTFDSFQVAQIAGMEDLYKHLYDRYSSSVHSDAKSISECFFNNNDELEFDILPKTNQIKSIIATNVHAFCRVLGIWDGIFKLKYRQDLDDIGQEVVQVFDVLNKEKLKEQD